MVLWFWMLLEEEKNAGLIVKFLGRGSIKAQSIRKGEGFKKGAVIKLELA